MLVMFIRMTISLDSLDNAVCKYEAEHHGCVELQTVNTLPLETQLYPQDRVDVAQLRLLDLGDYQGLVILISSWDQVYWQEVKEEDVSPSQHHLCLIQKPGRLHSLLLRALLSPLRPLLLCLLKHYLKHLLLLYDLPLNFPVLRVRVRVIVPFGLFHHVLQLPPHRLHLSLELSLLDFCPFMTQHCLAFRDVKEVFEGQESLPDQLDEQGTHKEHHEVLNYHFYYYL